MDLHCYYLDALDHVLGWDLPDEASVSAVTRQAALLAGLDTDAIGCSDPG